MPSYYSGGVSAHLSITPLSDTTVDTTKLTENTVQRGKILRINELLSSASPLQERLVSDQEGDPFRYIGTNKDLPFLLANVKRPPTESEKSPELTREDENATLGQQYSRASSSSSSSSSLISIVNGDRVNVAGDNTTSSSHKRRPQSTAAFDALLAPTTSTLTSAPENEDEASEVEDESLSQDDAPQGDDEGLQGDDEVPEADQASDSQSGPTSSRNLTPDNNDDIFEDEEVPFFRDVQRIQAKSKASSSARSLRNGRPISASLPRPPRKHRAARDKKHQNSQTTAKSRHKDGKLPQDGSQLFLMQDDSLFTRQVLKLQADTDANNSARALRNGRQIPAVIQKPLRERRTDPNSISKPSDIEDEALKNGEEAPTNDDEASKDDDEPKYDDGLPENDDEVPKSEGETGDQNCDSEDESTFMRGVRKLQAQSDANRTARSLRHPRQAPSIIPNPAHESPPVLTPGPDPSQNTDTSKAVADALVLAVDFDSKAFNHSMDIKVEVYYNGVLCGSTFITRKHAKRAKATSYPLIFAGHRLHCGTERPWLLLRSDQPLTTNGASATDKQVEKARERWNAIGTELRTEATSRGVNTYGEPSPTSEYLQSLASLPFQGPATTSSTMGIIDVVISLGHGKRFGASKGYIYKPVRMADHRFSIANRNLSAPIIEIEDTPERSPRLTPRASEPVEENVLDIIESAVIEDVIPISLLERSTLPSSVPTVDLDTISKTSHNPITKERTRRSTRQSDRHRARLNFQFPKKLFERLPENPFELPANISSVNQFRSGSVMDGTPPPGFCASKGTNSSTARSEQSHTTLQAKLGPSRLSASVPDGVQARSKIASNLAGSYASNNGDKGDITLEQAEISTSFFKNQQQIGFSNASNHTESSNVQIPPKLSSIADPGRAEHFEMIESPRIRTRAASEYVEAVYWEKPRKRSKIASEPPTSEKTEALTDVEPQNSFERPNTRFKHLARPSNPAKRTYLRNGELSNSGAEAKEKSISPAPKKRKFFSHVEIEQPKRSVAARRLIAVPESTAADTALEPDMPTQPKVAETTNDVHASPQRAAAENARRADTTPRNTVADIIGKTCTMTQTKTAEAARRADLALKVTAAETIHNADAISQTNTAEIPRSVIVIPKITAAEIARRAGADPQGRLMSRLFSSQTADVLHETSAWPEEPLVVKPAKKRGRPAKRRKINTTEEPAMHEDLTTSLPSESSLLQQDYPTSSSALLEADAQILFTAASSLANSPVGSMSVKSIKAKSTLERHIAQHDGSPDSRSAVSVPIKARFVPTKSSLASVSNASQMPPPAKPAVGTSYKDRSHHSSTVPSLSQSPGGYPFAGYSSNPPIMSPPLPSPPTQSPAAYPVKAFTSINPRMPSFGQSPILKNPFKVNFNPRKQSSPARISGQVSAQPLNSLAAVQDASSVCSLYSNPYAPVNDPAEVMPQYVNPLDTVKNLPYIFPRYVSAFTTVKDSAQMFPRRINALDTFPSGSVSSSYIGGHGPADNLESEYTAETVHDPSKGGDQDALKVPAQQNLKLKERVLDSRDIQPRKSDRVRTQTNNQQRIVPAVSVEPSTPQLPKPLGNSLKQQNSTYRPHSEVPDVLSIIPTLEQTPKRPQVATRQAPSNALDRDPNNQEAATDQAPQSNLGQVKGGEELVTEQAPPSACVQGSSNQQAAIEQVLQNDPSQSKGSGKGATEQVPSRATREGSAGTNETLSCIVVADRRNMPVAVADRRHFQTRAASMAETHAWEMPRLSKSSICTYAVPSLCGGKVIGKEKMSEKEIVAGMCRPIKQEFYGEFLEDSILVGMRFVVN